MLLLLLLILVVMQIQLLSRLSDKEMKEEIALMRLAVKESQDNNHNSNQLTTKSNGMDIS
jgi:hypothetical protein